MQSSSKDAATGRPVIKKRTMRQYVGVSMRGFAMGVCEIIPGVSGGTMAFILGIYEELIDTIKSVGDPEVLRAAMRFKIGRLFEMLNWRFVLALVIGMGVAVVSLAGLLHWLIENQPELLWSFFFGLVLASVALVSRRAGAWNVALVVMFVAAAVGAYLLVGLQPSSTPDDWWFLTFAGAVAASALILPGVSGSYLLLLMQKYEYVLGAVRDVNIGVLIWVAIGVLIGLVTFAQIVSWVFKHYHDGAVAVLSGLMLGSLRALWPWKEGVGCAEDPELCINVIPAFSGEVVAAIVLALVGMAAIIAIEYFGNLQATKSTTTT